MAEAKPICPPGSTTRGHSIKVSPLLRMGLLCSLMAPSIGAMSVTPGLREKDSITMFMRESLIGALGTKINLMTGALRSLSMAIDMRATSRMGTRAAKGSLSGLMGLFIQASSRKDTCGGKANFKEIMGSMKECL